MAKINIGTKSGVCQICGINCYEETNGKPSIWPCGVKACPYETAEQQAQIGTGKNYSDVGGSMQLPIYEGG